MAKQPSGKMIEPRLPTPYGSTGGTGLTPLPDDLLAAQCVRMALMYAVGAGLWIMGLIMGSLVLPDIERFGPYSAYIKSAGAATCLLMLAYARLSPCGHPRKTDVGLFMMSINAFLIALLNSWTEQPTTWRPLSWIAIVIIVYAMIAPATPRKMLVASLVAATMDPLAVWLAHLRGLPVPSVPMTFAMFYPNYACAVISVLPSHVLQRLGRQIRHAREMGSYELVELLGHGGMGEVWRARHRMLARDAAIKLVRPEVLGASSEAETRTILRRFEREAQATAALNSPHTINLFDFGMTHEGSFYYVMELLAGRDLESLIREFGPLPAGRAIYLLRQACHSLADAHSRGFVHRDVKPANIYVCRMGLEYDFVKVLDFGLVKVRDRREVGQTLLTAEHGTTGTPAYMAPEVILGEADVDRRADVYALGCVAYFMLTAQLVFEADTPMKMLVQHVQSRPVPPSQRTELEIPRELDQLVLACLEKDPNNRPRDAEQLFDLSCRCCRGEAWDTVHAKQWWEQHLPEFTGALTIPGAGPEIALPARMVAVG
jgi:tRNA A-37 threonylcarbamoyl transferase component Bud32